MRAVAGARPGDSRSWDALLSCPWAIARITDPTIQGMFSHGIMAAKRQIYATKDPVKSMQDIYAAVQKHNKQIADWEEKIPGRKIGLTRQRCRT